MKNVDTNLDPQATPERWIARDRSLPMAFSSTGASDFAVDVSNTDDCRFCRSGADRSGSRLGAAV
jgi:hypothetical protein